MLVVSILICNSEGSKLLVTTGWPAEDGITSEIIDLQNSDNECQNFQDFPYQVSGAIGGVLHNKYPVICGGQFKNETFDICQVLGMNKTMKMNYPRYLSAGVALNETVFFISGGSTYESRKDISNFHLIYRFNQNKPSCA